MPALFGTRRAAITRAPSKGGGDPAPPAGTDYLAWTDESGEQSLTWTDDSGEQALVWSL